MIRSVTAWSLCTILVAVSGGIGGAQTMPAPLASFAKAWGAVQSYRTAVNCYNVKGNTNATSSYNYSFTKPASISMDVLSGAGAGNNVAWSGGSTVVAGRGMFKKSFSLTDSAVTSLRGATVVDLSFGSILAHAQQTKGQLSASSTTLDGAAVTLANLNVADPASDGGLTREAIYLSNATNLPVRVDGYTGAELVTSCTFSNTTTQP